MTLRYLSSRHQKGRDTGLRFALSAVGSWESDIRPVAAGAPGCIVVVTSAVETGAGMTVVLVAVAVVPAPDGMTNGRLHHSHVLSFLLSIPHHLQYTEDPPTVCMLVCYLVDLVPRENESTHL